jgi:uncharacterized protein YegP (UPF0339 family)
MRFLKYRDGGGDWRWQLRADNGRIIADSGEGYRNPADCDHGISLVQGSRALPVRMGYRTALGGVVEVPPGNALSAFAPARPTLNALLSGKP